MKTFQHLQTCFFHFIRRFWYQVFICNWDKCNISASSIRSDAERYFWVSKRASRLINWVSYKKNKNSFWIQFIYQKKLFVFVGNVDDEDKLNLIVIVINDNDKNLNINFYASTLVKKNVLSDSMIEEYHQLKMIMIYQ